VLISTSDSCVRKVKEVLETGGAMFGPRGQQACPFWSNLIASLGACALPTPPSHGPSPTKQWNFRASRKLKASFNNLESKAMQELILQAILVIRKRIKGRRAYCFEIRIK